MSTAVVPNPTRPAPSLSRSVCAVLGAVARGAGEGRFVLIRRTAGSAHGASSIHVHGPEINPEWLPPSVLSLLEGSPSPWAVSLAATHGRSLDAASLSALSVSVPVPFECINPKKPNSPHGRRWCFDPQKVAEVLARLESYTAPPTLIVKALPRFVAVWALEAALTSPSDVARARDIAQALSTALGGSPMGDTWPATSTVPLPGTLSSVDHPGLVARCTLLEDRRYTLEELAASTAPKRGKRKS